MIKGAVNTLSKEFGMSKSATEDVVKTMIEQVEQDVKSRPDEPSTTNKPMTDEEKILGLQKMVEDKVTENNLNLEEVG